MNWTKAKLVVALTSVMLLIATVAVMTLTTSGQSPKKGPLIIDESAPESATVPSRFWAAAFSPDAKTLATTGGGYNAPLEAGEIVLWDLTLGRERLVRRQPSTIRTVAFSSDA